MLEEEITITCPYCCEPVSLLIDCTGGNQTYVEDCSVCCQPIVVGFSLNADGEVESIEISAENQ